MNLPALASAASDLLTFLDKCGRSACLIGGIVVSRWGEPRATQYVDVTVLSDFGDVFVSPSPGDEEQSC